MRFRASALIRRFFGAGFTGVTFCFFSAAHRFRCAAAILARAAARKPGAGLEGFSRQVLPCVSLDQWQGRPHRTRTWTGAPVADQHRAVRRRDVEPFP